MTSDLHRAAIQQVLDLLIAGDKAGARATLERIGPAIHAEAASPDIHAALAFLGAYAVADMPLDAPACASAQALYEIATGPTLAE